MKLNNILKLISVITIIIAILMVTMQVKATDDLEELLNQSGSFEDMPSTSGIVKVTDITLDKTSVSLKVGETETITPTIAPEDATNKNVTYTSSDTSIATVVDGKITAIKEGTATITVKTEESGFSKECIVTVTSANTSTYTNNTSNNEIAKNDIVKNDTTSNTNLAKAGIEDWNVGIVLIFVAAISAIYAIKKINDYKNI